MASTTNALDLVISIAQSLATEFPAPTTVSSTFATSTSTSAATSTNAATSSSFSSSTSASPSSSPTTAAASQGQSSGLSSTARTIIIAVCTVVGVLLLALLALLIFCCLRRRRRKRTNKDTTVSEKKDLRRSSVSNEWHHGNNSHHGYVGVPLGESRSHHEMIERQAGPKTPRASTSRIDDEDGIDPPNIAHHPAYARDADPYTAAGVGAAGATAAGTVAANRRSMEQEKARRQSLGERRLSDHMPTRKPVGTPPGMPSNQRSPNNLRIDTGTAAGLGVGALAGAAAYHKLPSQKTPDRSRHSAGYSDPFVSPTAQQSQVTAASPLSSHPSNSILHQPGSQRQSRRFSWEEPERDLAHVPVQDEPTAWKSKNKRPPTPLGFDFGIPQHNTGIAEPSQGDSESQPLASDLEQQPLTAAVSKYNARPHSGEIGPPTPAQRRSLDGRSMHFIDYANTEPQAQVPDVPIVPPVPERSPRRLSRASFDEPFLPATGHEYSHSPKRTSLHKSRESLGGPHDVFRDSGDYAYASPRSTYSTSPHRSPNIGPALGHRSREILPDHSTQYGQPTQPYASSGRSQALARPSSHGFYGVENPAFADSVDSWVSAKEVPTPWEDNAIRRNSSSGQLRKPQFEYERSSSGETAAAHRHSLPSESTARSSPLLVGGGQRTAYHKGYNGDGGAGAGSQEYAGPGGHYDSTWGEGHVEEPVFEKHGAQHSRRRSGSSGFDPRYGRWTGSTFPDNFGVGEAM